jgi:hypothetical protein
LLPASARLRHPIEVLGQGVCPLAAGYSLSGSGSLLPPCVGVQLVVTIQADPVTIQADPE